MNVKKIIANFWIHLHEHSVKGQILRLFWFVLWYLIAGQAYMIFSTILGDIFHHRLLWIIYRVSFNFWSLFYNNLSTSTPNTIVINNINVIQLYSGCSGLDPLFRITFILILYPLIWKTKIWLFPLSWFIILFAATFHFILLIPIACHYPEYYNLSHNWLTKIIFYGFFFLVWIIGERIGYPKIKMTL